jgi:hypothetical protein
LSGRVVRCIAARNANPAVEPCYYVAIAFRQLPAEAVAALTVIVRIER